MLKTILVWLKYNFLDILFILILIGLSVFISCRNYTPNTFLTGWDNLHPEFNFPLNISRSISSVWQEYQGVGLLGGMAHSADLPRQLILWAFSFVLPLNFIRYFWTFLMLGIGPVGVYFLVKQNTSRLAGFVAGLVYLFNLVTVQTFYTPFETFSSFYGFFPWLLVFATNYIKTGSKKSLTAYSFISILATCAFYVQTLFVVYTISLVIFAIWSIFKFKKEGFNRSLKLGSLTLLINSFWLLPVVYFTITSGTIPGNSHINSIATPETQLMNLARAKPTDVVTYKGYWFDYFDLDNNGKFDYLYKNWISYTSNDTFTRVSYILFAISVVGLIFSDFSYVILLAISCFMLLGGAFHSTSLLAEIFRNAFTKWSNVLILITSVGLGTFVYKSRKLGILTAGLIIFGAVYTVYPVLNGNLISKSMQVSIPNDYFEVFNYFKTQDTTKRIATFPLTDFWGWHFFDWGARGSGFLWYGIEQPILDRTFDVWSPNNENFYSEINRAISYGTVSDFQNTLSKYQVSYILFDDSVIQPGDASSPKYIQNQKNFLSLVPNLNKVKTIGKVTIYEYSGVSTNLFISAPKTTFNDDSFQETSDKPEVKETFPAGQGYSTAKNCDLKEIGLVAKTKMNQGNFYGAYNGAIECDYFYYPTLDYSKAYTMRIKGKNITGRSVKFYLFNVKSGRVDDIELLPTGDFDESYQILPTGVGKDEGYTLNIEVRSFGSQKSENIISDIEFYPANYLQGSTLLIPNNLVIKNVKKYGTWGYKVDVEGNGLMQLGQGFDPGWIAIPTRNYQLSIYNLQSIINLPIFKQELKHSKVSSWANSWVVDSANCSNENSLKIGNCTLLIVYWPQILEWVGAVLGIVATLILGLTHLKNRLY
ncbi:MAG TPA: 6-pyruvoyl-tetrahydropterin synthase-related protein [Patescibacteria group bacterium]|nr:6-pyruvoyl-tetrahydropterin synthase-related protein [Patescibacteria group bacterium]